MPNKTSTVPITTRNVASQVFDSIHESWMPVKGGKTTKTRCAGPLLHGPSELVRLRQAMREAAGVGTVAAPAGQFLEGHALIAAGRILPGEAGPGIEGDDIRQRSTFVFLQAHAAAARHLRHLIDREDHHLVVGADRRDHVAGDGCDSARLVRHLDVQNLLALAGVTDAIVLVDDEALPLAARNQVFAPALVDEQRDDGGVLIEIDEHPDRLAMAASAQELRNFERIEFAVG